jgi:hypothetical protein
MSNRNETYIESFYRKQVRKAAMLGNPECKKLVARNFRSVGICITKKERKAMAKENDGERKFCR